MTRPRDSLLAMFDPLATGPEVRNVSSPELSSSDKENGQPAARQSSGDSPITLTKFFNRTYTRHKTLPAPLPKGRLIDFDVSMDDDTDTDAMASADEDMENEDMENVKPSPSSTAPITPRRRVLAEIALDDEHTPMALKAPPPAFVLPKSPMSSDKPTAAPASSPLASVINSINGITSPPSSPPNSPPLISVLPPPPGSPSPKRRHTGTSLSARPVSIDLQSSFSMHLRETSFDLLNDKISFLGNEGTMEDVDMEVKPRNVTTIAKHFGSKSGPGKIGRTSLGYESDKGGLADVESDCDVDVEDALVERLKDVRLGDDDEMDDKATPEPELEVPPPMTPACNRSRAPSDPAPPAPQKASSFTRHAPGHLSAADANTRLRTRISLVPVSHPSPMRGYALPSVSALRVIKKTKGHDRTDSSSTSSSNASSAAAPSSNTSVSTTNSQFQSSAPKVVARSSSPQPAKTTVVGVQRPPTGATLASRPTALPPSRPALRAPTTAATSITSSPSSRPTSKVGAPSTLKMGTSSRMRPRPEPVTGSTTLRRASTASAATSRSSMTTTKPSGLRPPSRFCVLPATGAVSMVPRPSVSKASIATTSVAPTPSTNTSEIARILRGPAAARRRA